MAGHKRPNTRHKNLRQFCAVYHSHTQAPFSSNKPDCAHKTSFRTHIKYTAGVDKSWAPGCQGSVAKNLQHDYASFFSHLHKKNTSTSPHAPNRKRPDNSEGHRSLSNCGSSGWSAFVTLRRWLETGGWLQTSVKFTDQPVLNQPFT